MWNHESLIESFKYALESLGYEPDITVRGLDEVSNWTLDNSQDIVVDYVKSHIETSIEDKVAIDIADYYIPHLNILSEISSAKFIHIRMPRKLTIKSHFYSNPDNNFFQDHDRLIFERSSKDLQYPTYSSDLLRIEAIARYCDEYEKAVDYFAESNPDRIIILNLDLQTSEDTITSMLEHMFPNDSISPNLVVPMTFTTRDHPILYHHEMPWRKKIRHEYL